MKCILYARVSTDKQAERELSIPAQLQAMRDYAHQREWQIVSEYIEAGASARTADRPELQRLLSCVRENHEQIDVVLVHKIDRLARNLYDHATIKAALKQRNVRLASVVENTEDTVSGELVENIMASIAQFYSANLGEEARKGMRQKVLSGGWPHKAPRGYVSIRNVGRPGSHLELHRRESVLLRTAFELYATGHYSVKILAQRLAKDGLATGTGKPLAASYLRRMLANAFYMGRIQWGGLDVAGSHPALVSSQLFEKVQAVIAGKYRNAGRKGSVAGFPLRGIAICAACRTRMTAERHERWGYYRCGRNAYRAADCPASSCNADTAHKTLEGLCQRIRISRQVADGILRVADRIIKERVDQAESRRCHLEGELSDLLQSEMHLTKGFTAGDLSPNLFRVKSKELGQRRTGINMELGRLPLNAQQLSAKVSRILHLSTSMWELYQQLGDPRRAELLAEVFSSVVISREGIAGFTLRPPFDQISATPGERISDRQTRLASSIVDAA